jgi:hypothetical protein
VAVAASGAVRGVDGPVLVASSSQTSVALRGARPVATFGGTALWRPRAGAQLGAVVENRLHDGRVLEKGSMQVWGGTQRLSGWIVLRAGAPRELGAATVRVDGKVFAIPAGGERVVRVRACGTGPWRGSFVAAPVRVVAEQWQSPLLGMPRYVADPTACR